MMRERPGIFVVSLDFELGWGAPGGRVPGHYRANFEGVRAAVAGMLELFLEFEVHATWATVGLLFFRDRETLRSYLPARRPGYVRGDLSPYPYVETELGADEAGDPLHYAESVIESIRRVPFQEVGTHTFSHYYCLEPGQDEAAFEDDLVAARRSGARLGLDLRSLVFPVNQWNPQYLGVCARQGITTFRGNEEAWLYEARDHGGESRWRRVLRLADAYVNLTGPSTFELPAGPGVPRNLPASRFLRPVRPGLAALEWLRLRRILGGMRHAARTGRVYHLWWHPHNFGVRTAENLAFLRSVLEEYRRLSGAGGMVSRNMGELAPAAPAAPVRGQDDEALTLGRSARAESGATYSS